VSEFSQEAFEICIRDVAARQCRIGARDGAAEVAVRLVAQVGHFVVGDRSIGRIAGVIDFTRT